MLLAILQAAPPDPAPTWQLYMSGVATLGAAAALWTARTVFFVRDEVRDLKRDVSGPNGENGIKSDVKKLTERVDDLEDWQLALEAVARAEREQYHGEERRQRSRRLRDMVLEQLRSERTDALTSIGDQP